MRRNGFGWLNQQGRLALGAAVRGHVWTRRKLRQGGHGQAQQGQTQYNVGGFHDAHRVFKGKSKMLTPRKGKE